MAGFFAMLLPERSNFGLNELLDVTPDTSCHSRGATNSHWTEFGRVWKLMRCISAKPVDLDSTQSATTLVDKHTCKIVLGAKEEVPMNIDARQSLGPVADL